MTRKKKPRKRLKYPQHADPQAKDGLSIAGYDAMMRMWMACGRKGERPRRTP